jgi:hypothetical protein
MKILAPKEDEFYDAAVYYTQNIQYTFQVYSGNYQKP